MATLMLSTIDNPYNPHTEWDEWLAYDESSGHNTSQLLARVANVGDNLSALDEVTEIQRAIQEIVDINSSGILIIVYKDSVIKPRIIS
jgi:hypothetical protein